MFWESEMKKWLEMPRHWKQVEVLPGRDDHRWRREQRRETGGMSRSAFQVLRE